MHELCLNFFYAVKIRIQTSYYATDLNQDQRLKNLFWVDAKSRFDYANFGDVMFFDTTYKNNDFKLPFVPFIGMNHHFQFVLLGCGLVGDQSKSTYTWLMQAWLRAMHSQAPKVILTDQDETLKEAIAEVLPRSRHCFCLWHILSKILEKLGSVTKQHENFMAKFCKCIFKSQTEEHFEYSWWKVVDRFDLRKDRWLQSLYDDRCRWVPTFMKNIFLAGLSTKQRLESISSSFDKCLLRKITLKAFLHQYNTMLLEKYEDEAKADLETWRKPPGLISPSPYGKQMATRYTHTVFQKFQVEVLGVVACHPKILSEDSTTTIFKVQNYEENQDHSVTWNEKKSDISCTCRLFEYNGFLCRHMIVLQISGVHSIPDKYILKRWTKDAKNRVPMRKVDSVESRVQLYSDICQQVFRLGDEASISQESYNIALDVVEKALQKCKSINNSVQGPSSHASDLQSLQEMTNNNCTGKTRTMINVLGKEKVQLEQVEMTEGINNSRDKRANLNFGAPVLDSSYEWRESIPETGQLNSRFPTVGGFIFTPEISHGVEQLNAVASSSSNYYMKRPSIHALRQSHSTTPTQGAPCLPQQRLHGLEQLRFRPLHVQNCFLIQDNLQKQHFRIMEK